MIQSGVNLVTTVVGFAVSSMFIVFVCTRLICARIQLSAARRSAVLVASRSDLSTIERGLRGLEPVVVQNFPTKNYGDHVLLLDEDTLCTVCLAEYKEKDVLRVLPHCGHAFHVSCIDMWLQHRSTCPVCRFSLRRSPERRRPPFLPLYSAAAPLRAAARPPPVHHCCGGASGEPRRSPPELAQERRLEPTPS
ncbi:E3 ubiquitin-protein ligase Os03g0188200-like [Wolffia australiana]